MTEEKKITVDELIKKVEAAKTDYPFKKHIVKKYLPHAEKIALVKGVIDATSYVEVNGKQIYKRDTPNMMFVFSMRLIKEYTDITFESVVNDYDALVSSGSMNNILSAIPSEEISILKSMLDISRDDVEFNTRSIVSFLETKFDSLDIAINSLLEILGRPEVKAKIEELKNADS